MKVEISRVIEYMFGREFAVHVALYDMGASYLLQHGDDIDSLDIVYEDANEDED